MILSSPQAVIDFWFSPASQPRWFSPTRAFDKSCEMRFGEQIERAGRGDFDDWLKTPQGYLGVILLLDQLTRNVYRGSPQAFAHDAKALAVAKSLTDHGMDTRMSRTWRIFAYLPFEHSEDRDDQARSVELFEALGEPMALDYAIRHKVIIDRFGRFPHRNTVLGRESSAEEMEFLTQPGSSF